jgi:putative hydrolase of the HAD superfamily
VTGAPITTIVSDFGGVLSTPLWPAFAAVQEAFGIPSDALGGAMARAGEARGISLLEELECGRMAESDFLAALGEALEADVGRPVAMHEFPDRYWAALHPNPELIEHLAALRAGGYRMGLLTNNVREWEPRWRAMLPVDELFDVVVDSAWVGLRKPDPAIYELTCQRLGAPASQCVLIDDFERNCDAARAFGMEAVRFVDTAQTIAELDALLSTRGAPPGIGHRAAG